MSENSPNLVTLLATPIPGIDDLEVERKKSNSALNFQHKT
jgi:hypothetical protein